MAFKATYLRIIGIFFIYKFDLEIQQLDILFTFFRLQCLANVYKRSVKNTGSRIPQLKEKYFL